MWFVERLSCLPALQLALLLLWDSIAGRRPLEIYYFAASKTGLNIMAAVSRLAKVQEADYSFLDIVDEEGGLAMERARLIDPISVCQAASSAFWEKSLLVRIIGKRFDLARTLLYLEKAAEEEIARSATRIAVVSWFGRQPSKASSLPVSYFFSRSPWHRQLAVYAAQQGVILRKYRETSVPDFKKVASMALRSFRAGLRLLKTGFMKSLPSDSGSIGSVRPIVLNPKEHARPPFAVAVPYSGNGLTFDRSVNSDLFWAPYAGLEPEQLLVYAARGDDPIGSDRYNGLRESSIQAIAIKPSAKGHPSVPSWPRTSDLRGLVALVCPNLFWISVVFFASILCIGSTRWMGARFIRMVSAYVYWSWFFSRFHIKIQVDYQDNGKNRICSDMALADLGGVSVGYQRSYEAFPSLGRASSVDVHFAFGTDWANTEAASRSVIRHYVANGYVHDHAFPYVEERAESLREELRSNGAEFIICLLDENSYPDKRDGQHHTFIAEDYRYLLERMLTDSTLGLIFKPKKPMSLRSRLGPVADLLDQAIATGRCYIHTQGVIATEMLPCEASAAADCTVAIMYGSTAGLEVALFGAPTVMLDRELQLNHPLYSLGEGQVVFKTWDSLWTAFQEFRNGSGKRTKFGDWRPTLDKLDEFQDGKSAQRMGEYISWIREALARGDSRDAALSEAAERYVQTWGADKIANLYPAPLSNQSGGTEQIERSTRAI